MAPKRRTTRLNPGATPTPVTDTHTTTSVTNAQLQAMIDEGVTAALAAHDATRNGDDSHTSGTGAKRLVQVAHECTYPDFLKFQPLNFKGTEGVVGLTQWFEKMESVYNISNCTVACQVKFAMCTLQGNALTWWNSHIKTTTLEAAHAMPWRTLKKMMTDKYCPRGEIKKLEFEIVMETKPKTMQDAIEFATELMDKDRWWGRSDRFVGSEYGMGMDKSLATKLWTTNINTWLNVMGEEFEGELESPEEGDCETPRYLLLSRGVRGVDRQICHDPWRCIECSVLRANTKTRKSDYTKIEPGETRQNQCNPTPSKNECGPRNEDQTQERAMPSETEGPCAPKSHNATAILVIYYLVDYKNPGQVVLINGVESMWKCVLSVNFGFGDSNSRCREVG
ncbi:putative reverse transcriptase domain-containing protein [Tanacetum coccineum]